MQALALAITGPGACTSDTGAGAEGSADRPAAERFGGTAVIGSTIEIDNINPITWTSGYAQQLQRFVLFTPLLRYDQDLVPQPYGATSWSLGQDSAELTFHLRRDLRWHDGRATTAHDWKLAYELARDPRSGFLYAGYWTHYGSAEAVDSFTFRVKLRPHADFLDPWTSFAPLPAHLMAGVTPDELRHHPYGTREPVGNGPFRFVARVARQSWTFAANEDFPAPLGGRPYLDRLIWRVIPEEAALLTELLTARIDYFHRVPVDMVERIHTSGNAQIFDYLDRAYMHVEWNHRRPPLDDARVRRAFTLAIDRQTIVDVVARGYGVVANSPIAPMLWQYDSTAGATLRFDTVQARRLLAEAGLQDRNGDGFLEDAAGKPFRLSLSVAHAIKDRADAAQIIQADLRRVGINARVQLEEFNTLVARVFDVKRRDFDAAIFTNRVELRPDDTHLFHCEQRNERMNMVGYCNRAVDRLLEVLPTITDRSAALPVWREYQRLIADDQPYTFLYYPRQLAAVAHRLRGVAPDVRGDLVGVHGWWIDKRGTGASRKGNSNGKED